jgi:hypothetical protein
MKKSLSIVLSAICTVGVCLNFSACNDEKYQVSKEEYEAAFTVEALQNVTISMVGPYWERDHKKEYFYGAGENYALCKYSEDTQYYGRYYGVVDGEEFAYVYGNESLEDFTEEQAAWSKANNPSYYKTEGVNTFLSYKREFHFLEYDKKKKLYKYENTAYGPKMVYSYYFTDKKLIKFVITIEAENYEYICEFYDYETTEIPQEIVAIKDRK